MNRQRRTTKESGSITALRRSRSRRQRSWLHDCHLTCPNAGKLRFSTTLAAFFGSRTLLHESVHGPWRYEPVSHVSAAAGTLTVTAGAVAGCTQGVYRGSTPPGTPISQLLLSQRANLALFSQSFERRSSKEGPEKRRFRAVFEQFRAVLVRLRSFLSGSALSHL